MKFELITKEEYRKFWEKSAEKSFLSAPEMTDVKEGREALYYGVFMDKKIIGAIMIWETNKPLGGREFYAPRGFLGDYNDEELTSFFVKNLKDELKKRGGYVLRIEPNIERIERDVNGKIVDGGYNNQKIIDNLLQNGFRKVKYVEGVSQITWEFVMSVKNKTREDIMNGFSTTTKRGLKQAEALGVRIKDLKREEIKDFYKILTSTAERKSFKARDLEYFEKMYDVFHERGEVQFVSAVIRPKECIANLEEQKVICEKQNRKNALKSIESRLNKVKEAFSNVEEEEVTLASGVFFVMKPEILYLAGGNVGAYMKLGGQHMLQWEMIGRAIDGGYDKYNFYGIPENVEAHPKDYGVYEFKRGFGGKVVELVGEFELPLNNFKFNLMKILGKIRKII